MKNGWVSRHRMRCGEVWLEDEVRFGNNRTRPLAVPRQFYTQHGIRATRVCSPRKHGWLEEIHPQVLGRLADETSYGLGQTARQLGDEHSIAAKLMFLCRQW